MNSRTALVVALLVGCGSSSNTADSGADAGFAADGAACGYYPVNVDADDLATNPADLLYDAWNGGSVCPVDPNTSACLAYFSSIMPSVEVCQGTNPPCTPCTDRYIRSLAAQACTSPYVADLRMTGAGAILCAGF